MTPAWARIGKRGVRIGPIARQTKARCVKICSRSRPRVRDTWATIPTWNVTTRICGPMNIIFSTSPTDRHSKRPFLRLPHQRRKFPKWDALMREKQPRLLVIWGKYESSFDPSEPESYRRDVPKAEIHIIDGGHFALDIAP